MTKITISKEAAESIKRIIRRLRYRHDTGFIGCLSVQAIEELNNIIDSLVEPEQVEKSCKTCDFEKLSTDEQPCSSCNAGYINWQQKGKKNCWTCLFLTARGKLLHEKCGYTNCGSKNLKNWQPSKSCISCYHEEDKKKDSLISPCRQCHDSKNWQPKKEIVVEIDDFYMPLDPATLSTGEESKTKECEYLKNDDPQGYYCDNPEAAKNCGVSCKAEIKNTPPLPEKFKMMPIMKESELKFNDLIDYVSKLEERVRELEK